MVFPSSTSDLIPWLSNAINPKADPVTIDKNYTYYLDYQFNKKWDNGTQITAGATYEHMRSTSVTTGNHDSDNAALFFQYDQRFFDRLSVSAGMRAEYYRVDDFLREADTKIFGAKVPVKPIFRAGLNYQLADYSFIRASFGQGYRYPSLTEKYARKDIGGVGVFPNNEVKAEKGVNAELGFKQGYKFGNLMGFFDVAGFYTQYTDMIEFRFGFFDPQLLCLYQQHTGNPGYHCQRSDAGYRCTILQCIQSTHLWGRDKYKRFLQLQSRHQVIL